VTTSADIRRHGAEALDAVEPLWHALKNHHGACTPGIPVRSDADSWARRRSDYERWLAEPGAFLLVARAENRPVAFALVRMQEAGPTWIEPARHAVVQDLAVAAEARGSGLGQALIERVHDETGCEVVELTVLTANASARAFYDRLGFEPYAETLRRRRQ
jgi:ribosomal protein S18 acetylase RimI-like enzyme